MKETDDCTCLKIIGHLEDIKWTVSPRHYRPSPGHLALADWTQKPFIWMHYVESSDGFLTLDDVLMSTDTRYWDIHDVQRYLLADEHCDKVLFPYQYPNLRMPTPYDETLWRYNTATKLPPKLFMKTFLLDMDITFKKMMTNEAQVDRIIISDHLMKLHRMDYFKRKNFFSYLLNTLRRGNHTARLHAAAGGVQSFKLVKLQGTGRNFSLCGSFSLKDNLQLVSLENMRCTRLEGVRVLQQLAAFNAKTLKYLFLWDFFMQNENPLLINYRYITGSGQYVSRPDTKTCFLRSLSSLMQLRILAVEYSHLADGTGGAILSLLPVIKRTRFRLQIMCRENNIPGRTDAALGAGGYVIPDTAWKQIANSCPNLYLMMVFYRIRDYDNIRRFLMPSLGLCEVHWQLGVDLEMRQRQDSDLSCFFRHLAFRYSNTLKTLSVHQWRFVTFPLHAVLEKIPNLVRFIYVGYISDEVELKRFLDIIACGVCPRMKQIRISIMDEEKKRSYWDQVVHTLTEEYSNIMSLFDVQFCLDIYKH